MFVCVCVCVNGSLCWTGKTVFRLISFQHYDIASPPLFHQYQRLTILLKDNLNLQQAQIRTNIKKNKDNNIKKQQRYL